MAASEESVMVPVIVPVNACWAEARNGNAAANKTNEALRSIKKSPLGYFSFYPCECDYNLTAGACLLQLPPLHVYSSHLAGIEIDTARKIEGIRAASAVSAGVTDHPVVAAGTVVDADVVDVHGIVA